MTSNRFNYGFNPIQSRLKTRIYQDFKPGTIITTTMIDPGLKQNLIGIEVIIDLGLKS